MSNSSQPAFSYSETGFVASFTGTGLTVQLSDGGELYYTAVVDGTTVNAMLHGGNGTVTVTAASNLSADTHTLEFYRQTESAQGITTFKGITVTGGALNTPPAAPGRLIEIIGDSISCGYGDLCSSAGSGYKTSQQSAYDSWGAVAARSLGADVSIVARSGIGIYRDNTGSKTNTMPNVYGQTHYSPAAPAWGFSPKPQAVIINLGTNDFQQGDPGRANYEGAMLSFVQTIRSKYPDAYIFLTIGSMLSGSSYTSCSTYLQDVVTQSNDPKASYFALQTQASADYGCDTHPNVNRQKIMGDAAAAAIKAKLGW
jgi:lysophospholipase L1-like esterase